MNERGNTLLRWLDRYLGIPLIFLLVPFRRKHFFPTSLLRIAFLKSAGIGDLVILSAVIRDIQERYPSAKITLFTGTSNQEMGEMIPGVDVVALPITHPFKCLKKVRQSTFDLWIDCDPWPRINALFSFFSRSRFTIGFKTSKQMRHFLYDRAIPHSFKCHEIDNYRRLLHLTTGRLPSIPVKEREKRKRICLHLFPQGSRAYLKKWPMENWQTLIEFLVEQHYEVVLTGSAQDRPFLDTIASDEHVMNFAGRLSLQETASLLKTCVCVISVDTGIMHLAAALDCWVIGLHGPTSPKRWGALGDKVLAVTPNIDYKPCIQLGFESKCHRSRCMKAITVKQVKDALFLIQKEEQYESGHLSGGQRDTPLASLSQ